MHRKLYNIKSPLQKKFLTCRICKLIFLCHIADFLLFGSVYHSVCIFVEYLFCLPDFFVCFFLIFITSLLLTVCLFLLEYDSLNMTNIKGLQLKMDIHTCFNEDAGRSIHTTIATYCMLVCMYVHWDRGPHNWSCKAI